MRKRMFLKMTQIFPLNQLSYYCPSHSNFVVVRCCQFNTSDKQSKCAGVPWLFAELNLVVSPDILVDEMRFLFTC